MKLTGKFTQIPDEWWKLCGKHTVEGRSKPISISTTMIVLLAKVNSFANPRKLSGDGIETVQGQCTASSAYFADCLNVSEGTIRNMLNDLYALKLLKYYEQREGNLTVKRFLYVNEAALNEMLAEGTQKRKQKKIEIDNFFDDDDEI